MSPNTICAQWCTRKMRGRTGENTTAELIKHNYCRSEKLSNMLSQPKNQMCSKNRRSINKIKNHRYQKEVTVSCSSKNIGNAKSNNNYYNREQFHNCEDNISQSQIATVRTNCWQKQSINSSDGGDCVLNDECPTILKDCSKSYQQFDSPNPIRAVTNARFSPRNFVNQCHRRSGFNNSWKTVMIILIGLICTSSADQCALGLKTPGRTIPAGDIVLEYGQPLRILCMLNKTYIDLEFPGKNASDLVFFRADKEMEPEFITILNETTIEMFVEKPPPSKDMYFCKLRLDDGYTKKHEAVCLNVVVVGFQPQAPENFTCVSHNWEDMMCSWDPIHNYLETRVTLVFKLPGRAGGRKLYPCPKDNQQPLNPNTCLWDTSTNPIYRQPYEYYTFILNVENALGNISFPFRFHHFAHVIPAKPANLSIVNKTTESVLLHWSVPFPMQNFPPGLHHRIDYQHQWDTEKVWQVIYITNDIHAHKRYYNFTGIKYANAVYDVRVYMKSALANGEDKWSNYSDATFRSPPRLPGLPARTDIGSFEIMENKVNRDVYLYWKAIPDYLENGDNFKYQIAHIEENGRKVSIMPNETTRAYAKFKGISFKSYRFELLTTNAIGSHPEKASFFVPSRPETPDEPVAFTKIAFDEGLYELSWKPPIRNEKITNYTIFWCDNDRDRPYQCTGYLDWVHVSKSTTIYNMTVPDHRKVYQFAISANTQNGSSGMVWASCTVIHNKVIGKMKSVWINQRRSNNITVSWKLDCSDRIGNVEGFNIYYCPIVSPRNLQCKEPKQNTTIPAGPTTTSGVVTGLRPYTTYMISVAVLTKNGEGLHSNPLHDTTFEAAPATPPQNVRIGNVTNTTMYVSWDPPTAMNGVLRYYEVEYSGNIIKVDDFTHVLLKDLLPFKNYSIRINACTVECSAYSPVIYRLTEIGKPGKMMRPPKVQFVNSTHMTIMWTKPFHFGGNLDYYQVSSGDGPIKNSTQMEAQLPIPDCKGEGGRRVYYFRVRAVNIDNNGEHIVGPWSDSGENNCYSDGSSFRIYVVIWIISCMSGIVLLLCLVYTSKRMWLKCKAMQDVQVKLPPGLATREKLLQGGGGEQHIRQSSADSSHCSSGQESVTSSLTSGSHVSSDSGTEIDPITISQNKLLESSTTWETSSLRQRNVGTTRPGLLTDSLRWDSYVKGSKPGELIVDDAISLARSTPNLTDSSGFMMPQQAWSSTGYISMPSSEELSSNPSPAPPETEHTSCYSVVGVIPKIVHSKIDEPSESFHNVPLTSKDDVKPHVPYVSLASLEQKPQDKSKIDALHKLEHLKFTPMDQSSKPYVQTGLMKNMRKPFDMSTPTELPKRDLLQPSFQSTADPKKSGCLSTFIVNPSPSNMGMNDTISKPYVTVGSIPERLITTKPPPTTIVDEKRQQQCTSLDATNKPYVQASTVFQMLQHQKNKNDDTLCTEESKLDKSPRNLPIYCQSGDMESNALPELDMPVVASNVQSTHDYSTSTESPRIGENKTDTEISPYVQHQRMEKPIRPTGISATEEQYSKVAVAPHTTTMP